MKKKSCQNEAIIQNLKDAGCDEELITCFCKCEEKGQTREELCLLGKQRTHLLDNIHAEQKKLDCLDYLIYKLKAKIMQSCQKGCDCNCGEEKDVKKHD